MNGEQELQYLLWMTEVAGFSAVHGVQLLEAFGDAKAVWRASEEALGRAVHLEPHELKQINNRSLARPNQIMARCRLLNVRIMTIRDPDYPDRLRNIFDPPLVLYIRGRLPDFNTTPAIAVVGQRKATPYGRIIAEKLGYQLSRSGVVVVSGMAAGIDSAGHTGAVKGPTPTVAVFGTAIDQCYPAYNAALLRAILHNGAAVSEYPPGKHTYASSFPQRNRIISGLSLGVVVAEAPAKSGSLITAGLALDQGRDVFAVPGGVDAVSSEGCNELIARGAKLVRSAKDILEEYAGLFPLLTADDSLPPDSMEAPPPEPREAPAPKPKAPPVHSTKEKTPVKPPTLAAVFSPEHDDDPVLNAIDGIVQLDELAERLQMNSSELLGKLTLLELSGRVLQHPGQYYEKR